MACQADVIPATGTDYFTTNIEDGIALADAELDSVFLAEAKEVGLVTLKGHRSVGGMRASIYNAMPEEGVQALIDFMADFEKRHG